MERARERAREREREREHIIEVWQLLSDDIFLSERLFNNGFEPVTGALIDRLNFQTPHSQ